MRASLGQLDALIAAEGELVIRRRGEPIAQVLPMTPQRRHPAMPIYAGACSLCRLLR